MGVIDVIEDYCPTNLFKGMITKDDADGFVEGNTGEFNSFIFSVFKFPNYETVDFTCVITVCHSETTNCFLVGDDPATGCGEGGNEIWTASTSRRRRSITQNDDHQDCTLSF